MPRKPQAQKKSNRIKATGLEGMSKRTNQLRYQLAKLRKELKAIQTQLDSERIDRQLAQEQYDGWKKYAKQVVTKMTPVSQRNISRAKRIMEIDERIATVEKCLLIAADLGDREGALVDLYLNPTSYEYSGCDCAMREFRNALGQTRVGVMTNRILLALCVLRELKRDLLSDHIMAVNDLPYHGVDNLDKILVDGNVGNCFNSNNEAVDIPIRPPNLI